MKERPLSGGRLVVDMEGRKDQKKMQKRHRGMRRNDDMDKARIDKWNKSVIEWEKVIATMTNIKNRKEEIEKKKKEKEKAKIVQYNEHFGDKLQLNKKWPRSGKEKIIRKHSKNTKNP